MKRNFEFKLTPAYCLYNGAAVLEQDGAYIRFLVENKKDALLCGRLSRAFENYVGNVRLLKECPENFRRLIKIDFENGTRAQLKKCVLKLYKAGETEEEKSGASEQGQRERDAAAVLLLDSILSEARLRKASDIHIENCTVKLRINGRLETMMKLQNEKTLELVQRIKLLAGMNVIEKRRCQDGSFIYGSKDPVFIRVSTMAAMGDRLAGEESLVLRLLDAARIPLILGELGFNENQLHAIAGANGLLFQNRGLILICGPTGSGKSTTAASMLVELWKNAAGGLKIISLEDPPEYIIPGVTQVCVDERNSFSEALNHIFRQDPDVIMIGEIRDEESAAAALRASLTGHLVFATLHCGSAGEAVLRLENLGVKRELLSQILRGVICQELNVLGEKIRLYADVAIPAEKFAEKALEVKSMEALENLMVHYTNYHEIFSETISVLKKRADRNSSEKKRIEKSRPVLPFYQPGSQTGTAKEGENA